MLLRFHQYNFPVITRRHGDRAISLVLWLLDSFRAYFCWFLLPQVQELVWRCVTWGWTTHSHLFHLPCCGFLEWSPSATRGASLWDVRAVLYLSQHQEKKSAKGMAWTTNANSIQRAVTPHELGEWPLCDWANWKVTSHWGKTSPRVSAGGSLQKEKTRDKETYLIARKNEDGVPPKVTHTETRKRGEPLVLIKPRRILLFD